MKTRAEKTADYFRSCGTKQCATCERLTVGRSKYCREHKDKARRIWKENNAARREQLIREGLL